MLHIGILVRFSTINLYIVQKLWAPMYHYNLFTVETQESGILPTSRPVIYIPLVLWIWFKENRFFIEMNPSCENCHVKSMVYCLTSFMKQRPLSVSPWGCHVLKAEFKWAGRWFFLGIPAGFESCGRLRWGGRNPCRGLVERMPEMTAGWQTWIHKITVNHCGWRDRQALREN